MDDKLTDSCPNALSPGSHSPIEASEAARPPRFLELPAELRNRIYDLVVSDSSRQERHDIYHQSNKNFEPQFRRIWGPMVLTQTSRRIHKEFRPLCMSRLALAIDLTDVLAFTNTFLADVVNNPLSAPKSLRVRLDKDNSWQDATNLDIGPFLRIMSACSTSHDFSFESKKHNDWLSSVLNAAKGPLGDTWQDALDHDIAQVKLYLQQWLPIRITMKESMRSQGPWMDEWTLLNCRKSYGIDGAMIFMRNLGLVDHDVLDHIQITKGGAVEERRASRRQVQLEEAMEDDFLDLFSE